MSVRTPKMPRNLWLSLPWCAAVLAGFGVMARYTSTPGSSGSPQPQWPASTALTRSTDRATLMVFLHPHCPCSKASLEELNRLLATNSQHVETHVIFVRPAKFDPSWARTSLWRAATAIPDLRIHEDIDGCEARLFGATTSGCTLLYHTSGRLLFCGGITGARGHAGENIGERAALSGILTGHADPDRTPVFGCALGDPNPGDAPEVHTCQR